MFEESLPLPPLPPETEIHVQTLGVVTYWREDGFFFGRLAAAPEIVLQARTLFELKINLRDAHEMLAPGDAPRADEEAIG